MRWMRWTLFRRRHRIAEAGHLGPRPSRLEFRWRSEKHRHLDHLPVREQRQRLVALPRKPIAEFLKQGGAGADDVRHALQ
jgi:hypothetical protein